MKHATLAVAPELIDRGRFETFDTDHRVALVVFVVGAAVLVGYAARLRRTPDSAVGLDRACRVFAVLIPCFTVPAQVLQLLPAEWSLRTSLPLQICDFAWVVAVVALWTRRRWAVALNYFWALTLTIQGIVTPDLASTFPEPRSVMYWGMHLLIVWSAIFLTFGLRIGPTWREYRLAVVVTFAWMVAVLGFNQVADTNYGYLNAKPSRPTALDLLGPWPVYLVAEIAIVAGVWALMTWPWVRRRAGAVPTVR